MSEWIFWLLVVTIVYTYFGYSLVIVVMAMLFNRPVDRRDITLG